MYESIRLASFHSGIPAPVTAYPLHIDLLKCEHCGCHDKLLDFCSACGRARKTVIVAQPHDHRLDGGDRATCQTCFSRHRASSRCVYCYPYAAKKAKDPKGRPTEAIRWCGLVRQRYTDVGGLELVPVETRKTKRASKQREVKSSEPTPKVRTLVFRRDKCCLRCGTVKDLTLHHVVHRSRGGRNELTNLQTLCVKCHWHAHYVLLLPCGTPYAPELEGDRLPTPEEVELEWHRIRTERSAVRGKKLSGYRYGKELATNIAALFLTRLRAQIEREP